MANIALDLLGQARMLLARAGPRARRGREPAAARISSRSSGRSTSSATCGWSSTPTPTSPQLAAGC